MKKHILKLPFFLSACIFMSSLSQINTYADRPVLSYADLGDVKTGGKTLIYDGLKYRITKDAGIVSLGEVSVSLNTDLSVQNLVIPDIITIDSGTYLVTEISDYAFYANDNIKTIEIGKYIKEIAPTALTQTSGLESVYVNEENKNLSCLDGVLFDKTKTKLLKYPQSKSDNYYEPPSTLEEIGAYAFFDSVNLKEVNINSPLKKIGDYAFTGASSLYSISIGASVSEIGKYAFANTALKTISLSSELSELGEGVFASSELTNIELPSSVEKIPYAAFYNNENLYSVKHSAKYIDAFAFSRTGLSSVVIPQNVIEVENSAFSECLKLESVKFNDFTEKIGNKVFYGCSSLKTVRLSNGLKTLGNSVFDECNKLEAINISASNKYYASDNGILYTGGKKKLIKYPPSNPDTFFEIPVSVTEIEEGAFSDCRYLDEFKLEHTNGEFEVEDGILFDETKSVLIQYPLGKTLDTYTVPDSVRKIGTKAFKGALISGYINISYNVSEIGEYAFDNCPGLEAIYTNNTNRHYTSEDGVLYNIDKTELIKYPNKKADKFVVPNTVRIIKKGAFKDSPIKFAVLGDNVEKIEESAFENSKLETIEFNENLKKIYTRAFAKTPLKTINLPKTVDNIGSYTFEDCQFLSDITLNSQKVPYFGSNFIDGCYSLQNIYVEYNLKQEYTSAILNTGVENVHNLLKTHKTVVNKDVENV